LETLPAFINHNKRQSYFTSLQVPRIESDNNSMDFPIFEDDEIINPKEFPSCCSTSYYQQTKSQPSLRSPPSTSLEGLADGSMLSGVFWDGANLEQLENPSSLDESNHNNKSMDLSCYGKNAGFDYDALLRMPLLSEYTVPANRLTAIFHR
jgi:hypothetical protein